MEREIVEYRIVTDMDVGLLCRTVNELIARGWVPQGGPALGQGGFPMQAMVKYKSPNQ